MAEPIKIQFRPGINRESTDYGNTGGWYDCNLARIESGSWRSMGGWQKYTVSAMLGTQRSLFPWSTLDGKRYYGVGTNLKYYLIRGNTPVDVTPIRKTTDPMSANPFATSNGTTTVTVTDVAHGAVVNSYVTFSGATGPFGGVPAADINQEHQIASIVDANSYTITVATAATSTAAGGGTVAVAAYQLNAGLDTTADGNGWGTGAWGSDGWGEGSDVYLETDRLRLWTEDNFGEDLLYNVRNGGIYYKDMSTGVTDRGVNITSLSSTGNIPSIARQVLVSDNDRHVLAFATNTIGTAVQDPLLVRWSDAENLQQWTPDTTNSAGSLRIDGGSEFMKAIETTTELVVFTDATLHSMRFIGPPFTFGQTRIATNIQLIAPNAATTNGSDVFWMARGLFQMYDGVVRDLPCPIRSYVFDERLNTGQLGKIVAGINRANHEVIWLMPVDGSSENNFYVICNYEDVSNPAWYYGSFNTKGRTTWLDAFYENYPLAGAPDGYLYTHENGATDNSSGSEAMLDAWVESSVFELGGGDQFMLVSRTIPDVTFVGSTATSPGVNMTFARRDYPGSETDDGPDEGVTRTVALPIEQYTAKIDRRFRTRSVKIGIAATVVGTKWKLGVPRLYASPDGKRG